MRTIKGTAIDANQQKQLHRILTLSDLVKYAKEKPIAEENEEMFALAVNFIKQTKPKEEEKEEDNDEA